MAQPPLLTYCSGAELRDYHSHQPPRIVGSATISRRSRDRRGPGTALPGRRCGPRGGTPFPSRLQAAGAVVPCVGCKRGGGRGGPRPGLSLGFGGLGLRACSGRTLGARGYGRREGAGRPGRVPQRGPRGAPPSGPRLLGMWGTRRPLQPRLRGLPRKRGNRRAEGRGGAGKQENVGNGGVEP